MCPGNITKLPVLSVMIRRTEKEGWYTLSEKRYQISPNYLLREIGGEHVIVPVGEECVISNAVMNPNASAVFLWKAFQDPSTVDQVVQKGLQEYEVDEATLRNAVQRFVKEMLMLRILEEMD